MTAAIGTLGQMGIDASSPVAARFDFRSEGLALDEQVIDANGVRGTRSRNVTRTRLGLRPVAGPIVMEPNAVELALLLPWILGAAGSGSPTVTYALADTLPARYVTIDRVGKVFTYNGTKVDRATFRARQGEPLEVALDLVAIDETPANAGTFPSLAIPVANTPWVMTDLAITVAGTTITPPDFELSVSNFIARDRYFNSRTLVTVESLDREVVFSTTVPYGDFVALYGAGGSGVQVVATFTNGAAVLTITLAKVVYPSRSPTIPGRVEVMMPISGKVYQASDGTREIVVTENPGP